ncbi:MAG: hypothetical protein ACQETH_05445 [Candidatus Rifleibacteriota bacterium]
MRIKRRKSGIVMVIVLAVIATSMIFAVFLLNRSVDQGYEKKITIERTQLELLCLSTIEAAKLKIRTNPTELYKAFKYRDDVPAASRTAELYDKFLEDLNLQILDNEFATMSPDRIAEVTSIERLALRKAAGAVSVGYTEDYIRVTAQATSETLKSFDVKNEVTMNVTIQMKKYE